MCIRDSVLKQSGSSLDRVTFVRVYLVNFQDFDKVNKIYKSYFDENKLPARTCIGVTGLAVGASVEIDLIAKKWFRKKLIYEKER